MRKALIPMFVSLALCGAATMAVIVSTARAQPAPRKPVLVAALVGSNTMLAANDAPPPSPQSAGRARPGAGDMAAHLKQMCQDRYAHEVGGLAYLEAKLNLTAAQQPLFDRWKDAKLEVARRGQADCAMGDRLAMRDRAKMPSPVDGMAREEDRLKRRLADIDAERPVLEAFYNALTPAQRMDLNNPGMDGGPLRGFLRERMFAAMDRGRDRFGHDDTHGGAMGSDHPPGPPPER